MFNLDSRSKSKLALVVTLLAPVLAVQGVRTVFGLSGAPAGASAATTDPSPSSLTPGPVEVERPMTTLQLKARTWAMSRTRTLRPRSPMDRPDPPPILEPVRSTSIVETTPTTSTPAVDTSLPAMMLSAMVAGGKDGHPVVLINHKAYRIGDAVSPLWKVIRIDTKHRVVTLSGPGDRTAELRPPTPSMERTDLQEK
jgi:hypothetical protein